MNPFTPLLNAQRAVFESMGDAANRAAVAGDRLENIDSAEVGTTPSDVVYRENKLELRRYRPLTEKQHDTPILIVYALINRPYVLDLQSNRSVVRRLLEAGHDVYLIDWGEPSQLDASLGLEDYVNRYIENCVDVIRERSGRDAINLLGYCMGGTMATMYATLNPEKVSALGLMATGLCFDDTGGVLETWGDSEYYEPREVAETFGNVPAAFMEAGFAVMDPVHNTVTKYAQLYDRFENEDFVKNFARMEAWIHDGVDLAGEVYAEFLEDVYQDNLLCQSELTLGGERVDVSELDVPLLQIVAEYDHLVPPAASRPFNDVVGSDEVTTISTPTGHIGLAVSQSVHEHLWPEVAEWFLEQSAEPSLADVISEGVEEALGIDVETDVTTGRAGEMEIGIADETGEIARATIERDMQTIEEFFEDTLGIDIAVEVGEEGISIEVKHDGERTVTLLEHVGEAIREEVEEATRQQDFAASHELEEIKGIGPTYAGRLRDAGIDSVAQLAVSDARDVATAADASRDQARNWVSQARKLVRVKSESETRRGE